MKQDFKTAGFKKTREVYIGGNGNTERITIGGDSPVTIQTMWKEGITDVQDNPQKIEKIVQQINSLKLLGCDIIRFAKYLSTILDIIWETNELFFTLSYVENGQTKTAKVYTGSIPTELYRTGDNWVWKGVTFDLIEK